MDVQERLYHFDGEVVSKETYLEKLVLSDLQIIREFADLPGDAG